MAAWAHQLANKTFSAPNTKVNLRPWDAREHLVAVVGLSGFRAGRYYNGLRSCSRHTQSGRCLWTTRRSLPHTFLELEDGRKADYDTHCTVGVVTSFLPKRKLEESHYRCQQDGFLSRKLCLCCVRRKLFPVCSLRHLLHTGLLAWLRSLVGL